MNSYQRRKARREAQRQNVPGAPAVAVPQVQESNGGALAACDVIRACGSVLPKMPESLSTLLAFFRWCR